MIVEIIMSAAAILFFIISLFLFRGKGKTIILIVRYANKKAGK